MTENGQTTRKQINSSSYSAVPRYVVRGSGKPAETPAPSADPKDPSEADPKDDPEKKEPAEQEEPEEPAEEPEEEE